MNTRNYLEDILTRIEFRDPVHAHKIRATTQNLGSDYFVPANDFYAQYDRVLKQKGYGLDYGVDCYFRMLEDMAAERIHFVRTGRYSSSTFEEVEKCYYDKPEVMCYHMHGLALAQFLWFDQYERFSFFAKELHMHSNQINRYLEIGGGHGLYTYEALKTLGESTTFELMDTSSCSIELSRSIINTDRVNFLHKNVLDYANDTTYDFITMGEVLEHVEEPIVLLQKLKELMGCTGLSFISTPVNAPMIDHIYLFNNVQEIRDVIQDAELKIVKEKVVITEKISQQYAEKFKIPVMYAALIQPQN